MDNESETMPWPLMTPEPPPQGSTDMISVGGIVLLLTALATLLIKILNPVWSLIASKVSPGSGTATAAAVEKACADARQAGRVEALLEDMGKRLEGISDDMPTVKSSIADVATLRQEVARLSDLREAHNKLAENLRERMMRLETIVDQRIK